MSAVAPTDLVQASSRKKKSNKKKKTTEIKLNGNVAKSQDADVEGDEAEEPDTPSVNTPTLELLPEPQTLAQKNGHKEGSNGHIPEPKPQVPTKLQPSVQVEPAEENFESNASDTTDTSSRLEAMSQDREALRLEVEKLRKQLEEIQEKHNEELTNVKDELAETETAKDQAETNYQNLMGRVNSIKATLGERMAADKRDLGEARDQIEELEAQNESLRKSNQSLEAELSRLSSEEQDNSKELSSLRNRHNLSQQNWLKEREDLERLTKHLRDEADAAKEAMGDWEVLAMEERSIREGLAERVAELEDQLSGHKEAYERAASERDSQSQVVDGLQRALQEIQEARKVELREMVETTQAQLDALNKLVQQSDSRAAEAEAAKLSLETELQRTAPYEKEVKEKNLLIGKLRHEAIVLNDHLTKALRFLKKAKPEDNVDRQIVTSYFLQFLALDRSDPRKFQILQLIASLLGWSEEQRESAGLARPGASNSSLRVPFSTFHRTPSTPSLSDALDTPNATRESLAELWTGFLERQAEEGSTASSRAASVSGSMPVRPDTRG